jgi:hypothetical protein
MENMPSLTGGVTQTPAMLTEAGIPPTSNELGFPESRRFFTARGAISLPGGNVYTADAGVMGVDGYTEQLVITGGTGLYANATGTFYGTGSSTGNWGNFGGQLCYPREIR